MEQSIVSSVRRWRALGVVTGAASIATAAGAISAAGLMARTVVTPPRRASEDVAVLAVFEDADGLLVTLSATPESRLAGEPGEYSLWTDQGRSHAVIGEIVSSTWDTVTRRVVRVDYGVLDGSVRAARIGGWVWLHPEAAGLSAHDVVVDGPLGPNPAWLVDSDEETDLWAIHVHGRASRRAETIRSARVLHRFGAVNLLITYRNDGEATPSPDGRYGLGETEWEDVEAAIEYARSHGARRVLLVGWSMGGAIVLQTLARTRHRRTVIGAILDSPVVDWNESLVYRAEGSGIPRLVRRLALRMLARPWADRITGQAQPVSFESLNWVARAGELRKPVLIMHSDDDGYVPSGPSRELAAARPDKVTFVPFKTARHCKLWNFDADLWERSIAEWLGQHISGMRAGARP